MVVVLFVVQQLEVFSFLDRLIEKQESNSFSMQSPGVFSEGGTMIFSPPYGGGLKWPLESSKVRRKAGRFCHQDQ